MPSTQRRFRLFISSTFSDMQGERDALHKDVFPRLQRLCQSRDAIFHAVDLRWGVSREAQDERMVMKICLGEIDRCVKTTSRPNFLVLLGDRYGARLAPEEIPVVDFDEIQSVLGTTERGSTELELIGRWYCRDDNAVPAVYRLKTSADENSARAFWANEEKTLCAALRSVTSLAGFSSERRLPYVASATEREIHHRLFREVDEDNSAFCFFRHADGIPEGDLAKIFVDFDEAGKVDGDARTRLQDLKNRLRRRCSGHVHEYHAAWVVDGVSTDHLKKFCDDVYACLATLIESELGEADHTVSLLKDISAHYEFRVERSEKFFGRTEPLDVIDRYLSQPARHPLVIHGVSGVGKSALIAEALNRFRGDADALVYRFIGAVPGSENIQSLLESLCRQLRRRFGEDDEDSVTLKQSELVRDLWVQFSKATVAKPLIVFLDALDQLSGHNDARALEWLPIELPRNVHLIVSTTPGDCLNVIEDRIPDGDRYQLTALPYEDGRRLLAYWLDGADRTLQKGQLEYVLRSFQQAGGLPLYLRLAFEAAQLWRSDDPVELLAPDVPSLFRAQLTRLSLGANHGAVLVSRSLAYLTSGKNGLTEEELLEVLSSDPQVMENFHARSLHLTPDRVLPTIIWSRLYFDLSPYLTEHSIDNAVTLHFFHRQLREVVEADYLPGEAAVHCHSALASYFGAQPRELTYFGGSSINVRMLSELPFQQTLAQLWTDLDTTLSDFLFLQAKTIALGPALLIEDFERPAQLGLTFHLERKIESIQHFKLIQQALELGASILRQEPKQLLAQLTGRLRYSKDPRVQYLLSAAEKDALRPVLSLQSQSLYPPGGEQLQVLRGHTDKIRRVAVSDDCCIAVSASWDDNLRVWNTNTGESLHSFKLGSAATRALAVSADGLTAVSHDDENLLVWNLGSGLLCKRIEGLPGRVRCLALDAKANTVMFCIHKKLTADFIVKYGGRYIWKNVNAKLKELVGFRNWERVLDHIQYVEDSELLSWSRSIEGKEFIAQYWGEIEFIAEPSRLSWVWDLKAGMELHCLEVKRFDSFGVIAVGLSRDGKVGGSMGFPGLFVEWDLKKGCASQMLDYSTSIEVGGIGRLALNYDCRRAAYCNSQEIWVLDLQRFREPRRLRADGDELRTVAISADGHTVVSAERSRHSIVAWDLRSDKACRRFRGHAYDVEDVAVSGDGLTAISVSEDQTVRKWRTSASEVEIAAHDTKVVTVATNEDEDTVISASWDGNLKIWNVKTGKLQRDMQIVGGASEGLGKDIFGWTSKIWLSKNGRVAASYKSETLQLWDVENGQELPLQTKKKLSLSCLTFSHDGRIAILNGSEILDTLSGRVLSRLEGTSEGTMARPTMISEDLKTVLGGLNRSGRVWDLRSGRQRLRLGTWEGWRGFLRSALGFKFSGFGGVLGIALSSDGHAAVSCGWFSVRVWDCTTGKFRFLFLPQRDGGSLIAQTVRGLLVLGTSVLLRRKYEISGLGGGEADFYSDGQHDNREYQALEISAGGDIVVGATFGTRENEKDYTVRVWNLESMTEQHCFKGHEGPITDLAMTRQGDIVVSGSEDQTVRVWDIKTGECSGIFFTESPVTCVAVSRSNLFIAGCTNGAVHVLKLFD